MTTCTTPHIRRKNYRMSLSIFALLILLTTTVCNMPGLKVVQPQPTVIPLNLVYTAAALTLAVQMPPITSLSPPMATVGPPATQSQISTTTIPPTLTSSVPMIHATVNTNCRFGPGPEYDIVGYLTVGVFAQVVGRHGPGGWWYIQNPTHPGGFCWVWGETTVVEGDTSGLPVVTPPPTPTPSANFNISRVIFVTCGVEFMAAFSIGNTGAQGFESGSIMVKDTDTDTTLVDAWSDAPFMADPCDMPGNSSMGPGSVYLFSVPITGATAGHHGRATIKLCTKDDLGGVCITQKWTFIFII